VENTEHVVQQSRQDEEMQIKVGGRPVGTVALFLTLTEAGALSDALIELLDHSADSGWRTTVFADDRQAEITVAPQVGDQTA
jgi:hypothetical protein